MLFSHLGALARFKQTQVPAGPQLGGQIAGLREDRRQKLFLHLSLVEQGKESPEEVLAPLCSCLREMDLQMSAADFLLQPCGKGADKSLLEVLLENACWSSVACIAPLLPGGTLCGGRVFVEVGSNFAVVETTEGIGVLKDSSGLYGGGLQNRIPTGAGTKWFRNGGMYVGEWRDGQRCGYGEDHYNGYVDEGIFDRGMLVARREPVSSFRKLADAWMRPKSGRVKLI